MLTVVRWLVLAAAAAGLVSIAACGGEERLPRTDYRERVTALGDRASQNFGLFSDTSPTRAREAVARIRDNERAVAAELDRLRPPEEAEEAHDSLVAALRDSAAERHRLLRRLRGNAADLLIVARAGQRSPAQGAIGAAVKRLADLGYLERPAQRDGRPAG